MRNTSRQESALSLTIHRADEQPLALMNNLVFTPPTTNTMPNQFRTQDPTYGPVFQQQEHHPAQSLHANPINAQKTITQPSRISSGSIQPLHTKKAPDQIGWELSVIK